MLSGLTDAQAWAHNRQLGQKLVISWPAVGAAQYQDLSAWVASVEVDSSLDTDMPEGLRNATGYSSAQMRVTLSGRRTSSSVPQLPLLWLFSPWNSAGPLYRQQRLGVTVAWSVVVYTDTGPVTLRRFTGRIVDIDVTRGDSSSPSLVTITALDNNELLRGPAETPAFVANDVWQTAAYLSIKPGLNSQWVIDYLLRGAGIYASPPRRAAAILSATLHGSAYPELGSLNFAYYWSTDSRDAADVVQFAPGKFALATGETTPSTFGAGHPYNSIEWAASGTASQTTSSTTFVEGWFKVGAADNFVLWRLLAGVEVTGRVSCLAPATGDIQISLSRDGSTFVTATASGVLVGARAWHYIGVHITWGTTTTVRVRVDGTTTTLTPAMGAQSGSPLSRVQVYDTATEALQVTTEAFVSTMWNNAFVPTATLDPGLAELYVTPSLEDQDGRLPATGPVIQDIAAAELATFCGFRSDGSYLFRNRRNRQFPATSTMTCSTSIKKLGWRESVRTVRNRVRVGSTSYVVQPAGWVWLSDEPLVVPAGSTLTVNARFDSTVIGLSTTVISIPAGGVTGGLSGYRAARKEDGSGGQIANLSFTVTTHPQHAVVTVTNPNSYPAWLVNPTGFSSTAGIPNLQLWGQFVLDSTTASDTSTVGSASGSVADVSWPTSIAAYGEQLVDIPASIWRQRYDDALALGWDTLADLVDPIAELTDLQLLADPRAELADRSRVQDTDKLGLDDDIWIVGITETYGPDSGYAASYRTRMAGAPGQWILGDATKAALGSTTNL